MLLYHQRANSYYGRRHANYLRSETHPEAPTDLFNRRQQEASLRSKLNDVKRVMKSFVGDYSGTIDQHSV